MLENEHNMQQVLHSPFDIETHKKTFVNYCEVIIDEEGVVHYAVPSHIEKLLSMYIDKRYGPDSDVDRESVNKEIREALWKYGFDGIEYLTKFTGTISVWTFGFKGTPNQKQLNMLKTLRMSGVYLGPVYDRAAEERELLKPIMEDFKRLSEDVNGGHVEC